MTTPDLPEDDDPAAYKRVRYPLEGVAWAELWRIAQQGREGEKRMSNNDRALVAGALSVPSVPYDPMWRGKAREPRDDAPKGCEHEPETIKSLQEIQAIDAAIDASMAAFDAAWAEASKQPCKNHRWSNTDHACRCCECGLPLKDSDPTD